jgi:RNA polymerase sigma-70 factor (ECF subfamily)
VEPGDAALVARIVAGDEEALAEAFDRFAPLVFGLARRVAGDASLADDITQEIFTALWIHPERFDASRGSLRAYLGVQAHRRAVDAIRRDARRSAREDTHEHLTARTGPPPGDELDAAAVQTIVRDAVDRLPAEQRQVVELAYFCGYTQRELASALGIPEGTAKSRLRLAQSKLGAWLAPAMLELA